MAFPTPAALVLDENLQTHRGKMGAALRAKPLKPSAKSGLQERKALQDVSNTSKGTALKESSALKKGSTLKERIPLKNVTNTFNGTALKERSTLKERSGLRSHEAIKNPVKIFADEETKKCHEWAKDGMEGAHFTGNESQKFDKDVQDKRVKKKVENVMSALPYWSDVVFDPVMFPAKEVAKFFEEVNGLELEPEILPDINRHLSNSGDRAKLAEDSFTDDELDKYPFLEDKPVEFELKDEPAIMGLRVY